MIKLAACVVLYNPDNTVFDNIFTYGNYVDNLIVVDNSVKKNKLLIDELNKIFQSKIIYIDNNDNLGIATALNQSCDKALELGFKWILTMDQDSAFINFEHYKQCLEKVNNIPKVALLAANTNKEGFDKFDKENCDCSYKDDKFSVITSANIVNLEYFKDLGKFNDALFIDMVDYDYCIRINIKKLKILYFQNIFVEHKLGEVHLRKNIITGKRRYKTEHNAQRAYYIARNYLYIAKNYGNYFPKRVGMLHIINIVFIHDVTKILLYEPNKIKKLKAKAIGLYHFIINKYGKYSLK
ncbi:glycosyltransferase [Aliarcobacter skirrowii]|uniref:glycosyltransferase n=1 Tax=Aliarcobacter skirrowii TaxID=28200 RepID=UPI0029B8DF7F|nr:glycosyltransferase [Aliarcobacter skirrowii]MDX4049034.1 glycosyltransferase [Aliarcobacter skirrowii]